MPTKTCGECKWCMTPNGYSICKRHPPQPVHGHGHIPLHQLDQRFPVINANEMACGEFQQKPAT